MKIGPSLSIVTTVNRFSPYLTNKEPNATYLLTYLEVFV